MKTESITLPPFLSQNIRGENVLLSGEIAQVCLLGMGWGAGIKADLLLLPRGMKELLFAGT